jgi:hypothetical protein
VRWFLDGKTYVRTLDREDTDTTERVFTFPFVTDRTWELTYSISSGIGWDVTLIITDIEKTPYLAFQNPFQSVEAADGSLSIIRRSEWWANESLRYWSDAELEKSKKEWVERWRTPFVIEDTDATKYERELEAKRSQRIQEIRWDAAKVVSLQRYEWGKKLLWPIKKTKSVDRIVLHHTAENLEQDADDATLLRAIYSYHARTRGWWDIGYNYIIGQRGEIYEWRAGWDFVEWAHAFANNLGSVGISVIGNFETMKLNRDQRKWLESAIVYFAHKYGIDISNQLLESEHVRLDEIVFLMNKLSIDSMDIEMLGIRVVHESTSIHSSLIWEWRYHLVSVLSYQPRIHLELSSHFLKKIRYNMWVEQSMSPSEISCYEPHQ